MNERLNGDGLILSDRYEETMQSTVLPYLKERETVLTVQGAENRPLYCVTYRADEPRGTVVIVHGFDDITDKLEKAGG